MFLYFGKWNLLAPRLKTFLCFRKKTLTFWKKELSKLKRLKKPLWINFLYFKKWSFPVSRSKNSYIFCKKIFSYISGSNFQNLKNKNSLRFGKCNFLYLIFFIRTFMIRIIRRFFKVISNILKHLFFLNTIFKFF